MLDRREVLKFTAKSIALGVAGGFILKQVASAKSTTLLRPPGAKQESDFLASCIRCGLCVVNCPFDTLKLADVKDGIAVGTPFFEPRKTPCYMCPSLPCVAACPTSALDTSLVSTNDKLDASKSRIGVAVVDMKHCVAYWGIQCDACYRACPYIDKALYLEYKRNDRTQKHAFLLPVVDSDICTGCGLCERVCITQDPAIVVMPRDKVVGKVGNNYVKGWDSKDENRLNDTNTDIKLDSKKAIDYLNDEEF
ncbi:ferredoxin-type protein NapG [Campylobacter pinnipediorum]|uniref:ferredoxin-type protein NapG n=1 Tax=Campylobacter pinnipediorum TaxID=1965231 RepID=UPI0009950AA0|nr:ferredoxin-type protein NapG [Campylobacter pinnipediorum]AQW82355.1 menaquinol dehydrogenase NapGH, periplasmic component NapG [Campylobacter pinnipediorum subsp. pinnipediorum]